jgi:phosphatidylserine/phosphatidylglycerophosphate/cardiolipin synthase-like enzyme
MKKHSFILAAALAITALLPMAHATTGTPMDGCTFEAGYSPRKGGLPLVLQAIKEARSTIRMATYSFTEPAIAKALFDAHKRGVDVRIVADKDHAGRKSGPSPADFLASNGIPVVVAQGFAIMHNKYLAIDGRTLETGSYNFSRAAEDKNAENLLLIRNCPQLVSLYEADWQRLWATGIPLKGRY